MALAMCLARLRLKRDIIQIKVLMFQAKGDEGLELSVEGPGVEKTDIPANWLFHGAKKK